MAPYTAPYSQEEPTKATATAAKKPIATDRACASRSLPRTPPATRPITTPANIRSSIYPPLPGPSAICIRLPPLHGALSLLEPLTNCYQSGDRYPHTFDSTIFFGQRYFLRTTLLASHNNTARVPIDHSSGSLSQNNPTTHRGTEVARALESGLRQRLLSAP